MKKILTIGILLLTFGAVPSPAQEGAPSDFAPMFPFQPTHAAPSNLTNVKTWPGARQGEAGDQGFIVADGDHFVDSEGNVRRFIGTNICFKGCFPEKEDAEKVAAELSRYGINIVRLHYVHHKAPRDGIYPEKDSFIEPEQLDRFDYLLYQLKKNGIYTYFQLNISRHFTEADGVENAGRLWWNRIGVDNVDARMIELQKKYHKDILTHINPYTGLSYKDEPAIAMLELANENSILFTWFGESYDFSNLCEPYASQIKEKWNIWLKEKYGNTKNLKKAWLDGLKGDGKERIPGGKTSPDSKRYWSIQNDKLSAAEFETVKARRQDRLKGKYFLRLSISRKGAARQFPQFFGKGFPVKDGESYTLCFKIRSDKSASFKVRIGQNHAPYAVSGFSGKGSCGTEWKECKYHFTACMTDENVHLVFADMDKADYDIADISLVSGTGYQWPENRSIEKGNIDWPHPDEWSQIPCRAKDFTLFLGSLENLYFSGLYRNIRENIDSVHAITGTQLRFGMDISQAGMDYCDMHSYWNHPVFPGKAWDQAEWNVLNTALVNGQGAPCTNILNMGRNRILGKPLTVSEYDHPNLNGYSAEGNILVSAFGAFQNWSAIMQFAWTHEDNFFRDDLVPMFDMCSATHKLVHFPACYAMFVRGDIRKGSPDMIYATRSGTEKDAVSMAKALSEKGPTRASSPLMACSAMNLVSGKCIEELPGLFDTKGKTLVSSEEDLPRHIRESFDGKEMKSGTGELTWNWKTKGAGYFTADSPGTKAFTGFVRGRKFRFDGMTLSPGKSRQDWITFTLTNTAPGPETSPGRLGSGRYLLAITGECRGTDEVVVQLGSGRISCAEKNGGSKGTGPVLCEGIAAELTFDSLAGRLECFALDENGDRTTALPVSDTSDGSATVVLSPDYKTVWYELIVK